jgi:hypothetical protein
MTDETAYTETPFGARKPILPSVLSLGASTPSEVAQARARAKPSRKAKTVQEVQVPKRPVNLSAQILRWSFGATGSVIAFIIAIIYVTGADGETPFYLLAVMAGAVGAFFSALVRIYSDADYSKLLNSADAGSLRRWDLMVYSLVPSIVGILAAGVLFVIFGAGIVEGGALFPNFKCQLTGAECATFKDFLFNFGPSEATGYARTIVWCFIAGFAERLVPDKLRGLATGAEGSNTSLA